MFPPDLVVWLLIYKDACWCVSSPGDACPRYDVNGDGVISFQEMKALVLCDFPRNV